jgi:hypothetical protein
MNEPAIKRDSFWAIFLYLRGALDGLPPGIMHAIMENERREGPVRAEVLHVMAGLPVRGPAMIGPAVYNRQAIEDFECPPCTEGDTTGEASKAVDDDPAWSISSDAHSSILPRVIMTGVA